MTYIYRITDHSKSQYPHRRTDTNLSLFFHYQYIATRSYSICSYVCAFCFFSFSVPSFFHKNPISNKRFYVKTWYFALFSYRFCCSSYKEMACQSFLLRQQRNSVQRLTHFHSKRSNYYWLSRWPGMRCCLGGGLVLAALTCLNRVSQRLYCILLNVHIYLINFCRIRIEDGDNCIR